MSALQNKQPIDASNWLLYEIILFHLAKHLAVEDFNFSNYFNKNS